MAFCTSCGNEIQDDEAFCTRCGAPAQNEASALRGSETKNAVPSESSIANAPLTSPSGSEHETVPPADPPSVPSAPADLPSMPSSPAQRSEKKKTVIIVAVAVAVGVVIAAVTVAFALGVFGPSGESSQEGASTSEIESQPTESPQGDASSPATETASGVKLTHTYETKWTGGAQAPYPHFTFKYPDGWEVESEEVTEEFEKVELRKAGTEDVNVVYYLSSMSHYIGMPNGMPTRIAKLADSDFWPGTVQDTNMALMGPFMVADVDMHYYDAPVLGMLKRNEITQEELPEPMTSEVYVVLPESALEPGFPGLDSEGYWCVYFKYGPDGPRVSFSSNPGGMDPALMDDGTRDEIIAILASLSNGTTEEGYEEALAMANGRTGNVYVPEYMEDGPDSPDGPDGPEEAAYVLPDSDSRYYSEGELGDMDLYDLFLARNEIFARHGRKFQNQDLQDYFNGQSWYEGTISPDQFDESVLNDYEKKNSALMLEIEKRRNSPYLS